MIDTVLIWIEKNSRRWLHDLQQWLAIPSVSTDPSHVTDVHAAAEWAQFYLRTAGLDATLIPTPRHPCVLATTPAGMYPQNAPHVVIYGHYDVQPPDPLEAWSSPPFSPTINHGQIVARGASDDKGQTFCHMAALLAWREIAQQFPLRVTVLLEGEEEIGSPNLPEVIKNLKPQLSDASALIISDSSQFAPGIPAITSGLRGLIYYQLTLSGPNRDLHSGVYGGTVANPATVLCQLLGRLHDATGRVTIPGFYDDVAAVEANVRESWRKLPFSDEQFAQDVGVKKLYGEQGYSTIERRWCRPTLEINGLTAGFQGAGAKTIIPAKASAKVSMRLVPNQNPEKIKASFESYMQSMLPDGVSMQFDLFGSSPAVLTATNSPAITAAINAARAGLGAEPVIIREGGSIPVVNWFRQELGLESVLLGFGLPDDNLHSPNEKLDLDGFYGGIRTSALLLDELSQALSK